MGWAEVAGQCRFGDCRHERERGCAVQQAVADGRVPAARLESFQKLAHELAWLERRKDPRAQADAEPAMRSAMKSIRFHPKYRQ